MNAGPMIDRCWRAQHPELYGRDPVLEPPFQGPARSGQEDVTGFNVFPLSPEEETRDFIPIDAYGEILQFAAEGCRVILAQDDPMAMGD